ncbi:MAG: DUF2946 domain-containing protein [Paucibacter sp.]|nr:DUF2946 domain-containing protein [Roseateles sp.]
MQLRPGFKLCTGWVAILAVLLLAFAPLVSQALGADRYSAWVEICSAGGAKWVKADEGSRPAPQPSSHALEHCPYCSVHVSALGMPPAQLLLMPQAARLEPPQAFLAAPHTLHAWRGVQPRGPPFLGSRLVARA